MTRSVCCTIIAAFGMAAHGQDVPKLEIRDIRPTGFAVHRAGSQTPLLVQNAAADFRPHIHPLMAPDGN